MKHYRRSGAVLICVLVVLLIVGLISLQTIQTLLLVRRSDSDRSRLRQAQELVELSRIAFQQNGAGELQEEIAVVVDGDLTGTIRLSLADSESHADSGQADYRIVAKYPVGAGGEVTVTGVITETARSKP